MKTLRKLFRSGVDALSSALDRLQAAWPVERLVKALNPAISLAAGTAGAWVAAHFPGLPPFPPGYIAGIFGLLAGGTFTTINKILDGWQAEIARNHVAEQAAEDRATEVQIATLQTPAETEGLEAAQAAVAQRVTTEAEASVAAAAAVGAADTA